MLANLASRYDGMWSAGSSFYGLLPDPAKLDIELRKTGVTLRLLHHEYIEQNRTGAYGYTQFCAHYNAWKRTQLPTIVPVLEHLRQRVGDVFGLRDCSATASFPPTSLTLDGGGDVDCRGTPWKARDTLKERTKFVLSMGSQRFRVGARLERG